MLDYYMKILLKRWLLIVFCFIGVGLAVYIGSRLTTPVYQSTVVVQVAIQANNNQADIQGLLASDQLVQTESQLAISNIVLDQAVSRYHGLSVNELAKNVYSTVVPNTQLFQIQVVDSNPERAASLANDIASTLIKQQIQATLQSDAQSKQQIQQDLQQTQQQIESISSQITTLQAKASQITVSDAKGSINPQSDPRIIALNAQISSLQVRQNGLQQQSTDWQTLLDQLVLREAQSNNFLRIVQFAQPASSPTRPNVLSNTAIGLLVGLLNGLFLVMLLEQLDTRVHTAEDVAQLLEWPVLATVWRPDFSKKNSEELVGPPPHNANVEAYRMLRTNLGFALMDKQLHSLVVTSSLPKEGKSTTAANLAIFMAIAGKKTLLIDADLRRPMIGELFHLPLNSMGLSNAIVACAQYLSAASRSLLQSSMLFPNGEFSLNSYMHTVNIPNLQIIPSGPLPPNPPELLDSKAMESLLAAIAASGAEVVIFDTPPLIGLSEASILASKADGILLVVDITHGNKKNLKQLKNLTTQWGGKVLGCVVNKQRRDRKDTSYSYYYYFSEEGSQSMQNGHNPAGAETSMLPGSIGQK